MGLTAAALGHLLASSQRESAYRQRPARADPRPAAGDGRGAADRARAAPLPVGCRSSVQLPRPDPSSDRENHHRAADLFTDGLSAAHSAADRFTILISLYDLALSRQADGELDDAADLLRQGLSLAAEAGDEPSLAYYLEALADVAARQGDPERAVGLLAAADALLEANGSGWLHAYVPRAPHGPRALAGLRARTTERGLRRRPGRTAAPSPFPAPSGTHCSTRRRNSHACHQGRGAPPRHRGTPGARTVAPDPDQPAAAPDGGRAQSRAEARQLGRALLRSGVRRWGQPAGRRAPGPSGPGHARALRLLLRPGLVAVGAVLLLRRPARVR